MSKNRNDNLDERIRRLLSELGDEIGQSVSNSADVAEAIRRIQEYGYHIYVVLDAKIGIDRDRKRAQDAARRTAGPHPAGASADEESTGGTARTRRLVARPGVTVEFRMNIGDALFLRSLGIDGTLRIRRARPTPFDSLSSGEPA